MHKNLYNIKVIATGKVIQGSIDSAFNSSKQDMKDIRDDMNGIAGSIKFCVTRGKDNLKSAKPHSRTGGK